ncbi:MAG: hypothetical protein Q7T71_07750, partial [Herbiconiux sp.]|nr:hypothetical protein [Herbiconiux sp.]
RAYDAAAHLLGNTRSVARASYVHPRALDAGRSAPVVAAVSAAMEAAGSQELRALLRDDGLVTALVGELRRLSVTLPG